MFWNHVNRSTLPWGNDPREKNPKITEEKKSWELLPLAIESFYSWDNGFMALDKVSILQQGCAYCPAERPPIISWPMHCYSLGIDMLHKSELLDCQVLFLRHWHDLPARDLASWWACIDLMLWGESPPLFLPDTHKHTFMVVHYAHPHTFQYPGMVYPISCIFFEARILNSDTPLSPVFPPTLICQQAVPSLRNRGIRAKARCLPSVHSHYASH